VVPVLWASGDRSASTPSVDQSPPSIPTAPETPRSPTTNLGSWDYGDISQFWL
jgi:hypothetical protein